MRYKVTLEEEQLKLLQKTVEHAVQRAQAEQSSSLDELIALSDALEFKYAEVERRM